MAEDILEPDLPIIDPHHHLWHRFHPGALPADPHAFEVMGRRYARYLLDEYLEDLRSGHNVRATVFVDCRSMYRAEGPEAIRPLGEVEFANGVAAMCDSGIYGDIGVCAGIVSKADLLLGDAVAEPLEAMIAASSRFRGIRNSASYDADPNVLGPLAHLKPGLYLSDAFRAGFRQLAALGLSFDAWLLEPQLPELLDLARTFPEQPIVLDHVGTPLGSARYEGRRDERFAGWRDNIRKLAELPAMHVKLGGLAMSFCGFAPDDAERGSSLWWAEQWRPYVETCIEAFGPERCMFESNFPVDKYGCDYAVMWNAFKRITAGASADEKTALYSGTAARFYRLSLQ